MPRRVPLALAGCVPPGAAGWRPLGFPAVNPYTPDAHGIDRASHALLLFRVPEFFTTP
jgi:hypothetical protein